MMLLPSLFEQLTALIEVPDIHVWSTLQFYLLERRSDEYTEKLDWQISPNKPMEFHYTGVQTTDRQLPWQHGEPWRA